MMDLGTIRELQADAALRAAEAKLEPWIVWPDDVGNVERLRRIPNLGTHLPDGWRRVDSVDEIGPHRSQWNTGRPDGKRGYFVDKSGFGSPNEPALTAQEMADLLKPGYGYAIVEEGQFQITIGVFKQT